MLKKLVECKKPKINMVRFTSGKIVKVNIEIVAVYFSVAIRVVIHLGSEVKKFRLKSVTPWKTSESKLKSVKRCSSSSVFSSTS